MEPKKVARVRPNTGPCSGCCCHESIPWRFPPWRGDAV